MAESEQSDLEPPFKGTPIQFQGQSVQKRRENGGGRHHTITTKAGLDALV